MRTSDVKSDVIFGFLAPENIEKTSWTTMDPRGIKMTNLRNYYLNCN